MTGLLENKRIILGVTGSIAAYKAAELASKLHQQGALVDVILTEKACEFISPLTFQSVTGRKAYVEKDLWGSEGHVTHIALGRAAELVVIAPASANTLAKLANGIADNLLTVTTLASHCPLIIAPAMDGGMYSHPATQENIERIKKRGAIFIGPASGHLASNLVGPGRMSEPIEIINSLRYLISRDGPLAGKKVVVTAGGTQEPIDPVRIVTNRSSGKQGYALAQSALDAGADVILISSPTALETPYGAELYCASTAAEMYRAVMEEVRDADFLLMAAAVADFHPIHFSVHKIKKDEGLPQIYMEETVDILQEVAKEKAKTGYPRWTIGFAAESQELIKNAYEKLKNKALDLIVANDISVADSGFSVDTNRVTFLFANGTQESLPTLSKREVADRVLSHVIQWLKNTAE